MATVAISDLVGAYILQFSRCRDSHRMLRTTTRRSWKESEVPSRPLGKSIEGIFHQPSQAFCSPTEMTRKTASRDYRMSPKGSTSGYHSKSVLSLQCLRVSFTFSRWDSHRMLRTTTRRSWKASRDYRMSPKGSTSGYHICHHRNNRLWVMLQKHHTT
jgi:hypothetical protein